MLPVMRWSMKSRERKVDVAKETVNRWVQRCRHQMTGSSSTTKSDEEEEGDADTGDDASGGADERCGETLAPSGQVGQGASSGTRLKAALQRMGRAKGPKSVTSGKTDLCPEAATALPRGKVMRKGRRRRPMVSSCGAVHAIESSMRRSCRSHSRASSQSLSASDEARGGSFMMRWGRCAAAAGCSRWRRVAPATSPSPPTSPRMHEDGQQEGE